MGISTTTIPSTANVDNTTIKVNSSGELEAIETSPLPLRTILAWGKGAGETLPSGWAECDGSVLSDSNSPMNGETLPDLNTANRFLRGNSTVGTTGGSVTHVHGIDTDITFNDDSGTGHAFSSADPDTNSGSSLPPYYDVIYIIKIYSPTGSVGTGVLTTSAFVTVGFNSSADYVCDGTEDNVQIQNAINLAATENKDVYLYGGTYDINAALEIPSNIVVRGSGTQTILQRDAAIHTMVGTAAIENVTISNLSFDGGGTNENIIQFADYESNDNIRIQDNWFYNSQNRAASLDGTNLWFSRNRVENCGWGVSMAKHSASTDEHSIIVSDNTFDNSQSDPGGSEYQEGVEINTHGYCKAIVSNNIFKGYREEGIDCNASLTIVTGNHIEMDSTETSASRGITVGVETTSDCSGIIANNVITGISNTAGTGIQLGGCTGLMIANNVIIGNSTNGGDHGIEINSSSTDITTMGNYIKDFDTGIRDFAGLRTTKRIGNTYNGCTSNFVESSAQKTDLDGEDTIQVARKTTTEISAISSPRSGSIIYNRTTNKLQVYNDSAWTDLH